MEEAEALVHAIGLPVAAREMPALPRPRPGTFFGQGVLERIGEILPQAKRSESAPVLVVVNAALTPVQQRNLERFWGAKVLDRTGLILEIFGARARTREARLQVALAHLTWQRSRLVRSWTHLERQRGGGGFMGGPGERQIEADRRQISARVLALRKELTAVRARRALQRRARSRRGLPVVALVGYTNAGKSTLFNRLTGENKDGRNRLFDTLDPTLRKVKLPGGREIILSDTVGFVSDLPHDLIAAFRATLEEVRRAAVIIHVRDAAHPDMAAQKRDVASILETLGSNLAGENVIKVLNKADLLDGYSRRRRGLPLALSARTGAGLDRLLDMIAERIDRDVERRLMRLDLGPKDGGALAFARAHGRILEQKACADGRLLVEAEMPAAAAGAFARRFPDCCA